MGLSVCLCCIGFRIMTLKPSDSLVYLYYNCSECGERGDEVRLKTAQQPHVTHVCIFCGHVDQIKQIKKVRASFYCQDTIEEDAPTKSELESIIARVQRHRVKRQLKAMGYSNIEANLAINSAIEGMLEFGVSRGWMTDDELFRSAVLAHDKVTA